MGVVGDTTGAAGMAATQGPWAANNAPARVSRDSESQKQIRFPRSALLCFPSSTGTSPPFPFPSAPLQQDLPLARERGDPPSAIAVPG